MLPALYTEFAVPPFLGTGGNDYCIIMPQSRLNPLMGEKTRASIPIIMVPMMPSVPPIFIGVTIVAVAP